jgi:hypothetical protein
MLEQAINYPRNSEDALRTIIIGGVLTLLGFLVVPLFFVYGYLIDVLRTGMDRSEEPPAFDDWESLLVDGVKMFAITFVYFLIPLAIFAVTVGGALISILSGNAGAGTVLGALAGFTIASLVSLVFYYVVPAALANFARSGEIASAFAFGELRPVLFSGSYAKGWLLALGVIIVAGVVTSLLNVVPLLGFVVGVFVTFYALVAAFYIYGQAFEDASRPPEAPESPAGQPAA